MGRAETDAECYNTHINCAAVAQSTRRHHLARWTLEARSGVRLQLSHRGASLIVRLTSLSRLRFQRTFKCERMVTPGAVCSADFGPSQADGDHRMRLGASGLVASRMLRSHLPLDLPRETPSRPALPATTLPSKLILLPPISVIVSRRRAARLTCLRRKKSVCVGKTYFRKESGRGSCHL